MEHLIWNMAVVANLKITPTYPPLALFSLCMDPFRFGLILCMDP